MECLGVFDYFNNADYELHVTTVSQDIFENNKYMWVVLVNFSLSHYKSGII